MGNIPADLSQVLPPHRISAYRLLNFSEWLFYGLSHVSHLLCCLCTTHSQMGVSLSLRSMCVDLCRKLCFCFTLLVSLASAHHFEDGLSKSVASLLSLFTLFAVPLMCPVTNSTTKSSGRDPSHSSCYVSTVWSMLL